jgi:hypothetical protein
MYDPSWPADSQNNIAATEMTFFRETDLRHAS